MLEEEKGRGEGKGGKKRIRPRLNREKRAARCQQVKTKSGAENRGKD